MRFYRDDDVPRELVSYRTLRRAVGVLGFLLPLVLVIVCYALGPCTSIQDSISDYYATRSRNLFVGILFAIAFFLFAYRGYDRQDDQAGDLACLFALGVALLPGTSPSGWVRAAHFASACALFLVLAYFSYFLFTKHGGSPTAEKLKRNRLYRACALTIVACILAIGLYLLLGRNTALPTLKPVFWLESIALWAFGLSWITKGETLWKDAPSA